MRRALPERALVDLNTPQATEQCSGVAAPGGRNGRTLPAMPAGATLSMVDDLPSGRRKKDAEADVVDRLLRLDPEAVS